MTERSNLKETDGHENRKGGTRLTWEGVSICMCVCAGLDCIVTVTVNNVKAWLPPDVIKYFYISLHLPRKSISQIFWLNQLLNHQVYIYLYKTLKAFTASASTETQH